MADATSAPGDEAAGTADAAGTGAGGDAAPGDAGTEGAQGAGDAQGAAGAGRDGDAFDLRGIVKQFTAPMIESLDARLREQVEAHADALLDEKVDAAVSDRLATIERAIADVSRSLAAVEQRLEALERAGAPEELE